RGVGLRERAVTAAAGVVPTAEVGELPAGRGGDEELAGVRIRKGRPRTVQCIGMVEKRRVAARLPTLGALTEAQLLTGAARDGVVALAPERHFHSRLTVECARERSGVHARAREQIDLPGA